MTPVPPGRSARLSGDGRRVRDLLATGERSFSFEFFPPKDAAGVTALWKALRELESLRPTFVSVTYGAGGSSRDTTIEITQRIARETTMTPMAHLTCVGHTRDELRSIVGAYADAGVRNVLTLRGDPPGGPGTDWTPTDGGLTYADELVALVRSLGDFSVGVAAFPEGHRDAADLDADIAVLRRKQDAGAEFAITEMVLRASDYFGLLDRARDAGVTIPILPGIMPITNLRQISRMAELSGRDVPADVVARVTRFEGDPEAVRAEGTTIAAELCEELLRNDAPGLHFYTLNRSRATREIYADLALPVS
jgi:methylenetetrahydrofolate reductase (NADPH)